MKVLSWVDQALIEFDTALRTLLPPEARVSKRAFPGADLENGPMSEQARRHAAGLMRVNHSGEVCAQALYQGQALTAKSSKIKAQLRQAAFEEVEHLAWCEQSLRELNASVSLLNPIWYSASLWLGAMAGFLGDKISLGFVAEVENQVEAHLASHLESLSEQDARSRAVLEQMKADEAEHAHQALAAGGYRFPYWLQQGMKLTAKLMTKTSYYL